MKGGANVAQYQYLIIFGSTIFGTPHESLILITDKEKLNFNPNQQLPIINTRVV